MSDQQVEITKEDIERVSDRLEGLMGELSEQEQNVLGLILTRAAAADDDAIEKAEAAARPHKDFTRPFAGQLANAAGMRGPDVTVVVGWQFRFNTPFEGRETKGIEHQVKPEITDKLRERGPGQ